MMKCKECKRFVPPELLPKEFCCIDHHVNFLESENASLKRFVEDVRFVRAELEDNWSVNTTLALLTEALTKIKDGG